MGAANHIPDMTLCTFIVTNIIPLHIRICECFEDLCNFSRSVARLNFEGEKDGCTIAAYVVSVNELGNSTRVDDAVEGDEAARI